MSKTRADVQKDINRVDDKIKKATREYETNKKKFGAGHSSTVRAQKDLTGLNNQLGKLQREQLGIRPDAYPGTEPTKSKSFGRR